jgi:hypothetical protein
MVRKLNTDGKTSLLDRLDQKLHTGNEILTCSVCGHTGSDVHELPTYDRALSRDSTGYFCDDRKMCEKRAMR